jgi:deoxyribonuclease-4
MKIRFGLKLWSTNTYLIDQAIQLIDEKTFDYIELFVVPDTKIDPFKIDVPYIIHIPHHKFGVNMGESSSKKYNLEKINESISWADKLNAKYLILHAGHGSMESAVDLLSEVIDNRLLIENMPKVGLNDEKMIGYSPEQIQELISINKAGLCLDFGHAVKAAVSLGLDYNEYVQGFMGFEPNIFHLSDGWLCEERDEHLSIGDGEYDLGFLMGCVEGSGAKMVTMETPREEKSLDEDMKNLSVLKNIRRST